MNKRGFSLIELLIAISFIAVLTVVILNTSLMNNRLRVRETERTNALFYTAEALEASKLISWGNLTSGQYHPVIQGNTWEFENGSQLLDNFYTRQVAVEDVYRQNISNGQVFGPIVSSGGYLDPDSKKITAIVSWQSKVGGANLQEQVSSYRFRWQAERWTQTDWSGGPGQADWSIATRFDSNTPGLSYMTDGTLTLNSGFVNWNDAASSAQYNLGNSRDANDIFLSGSTAYLVTDDNTSGTYPELYIVDVSDLYNPVTVSQTDLRIDNNARGIDVDNGYAYVVGNDDGDELVVVDVHDINNPFWVTSYNMSGSNDGLDVVADGSYLYVLRSSELTKFNISNPASPQYVGQYSVTSGARMSMSGDYIYLATGNSAREFLVVNKNTMNYAGEFDLSGTVVATAITVRGNYAYVGANQNSGREFYVLDISSLNSIQQAGSYEIGYNVYATAVTGAYAVLTTSNSSKDVYILDVSAPATISEAGSANLTDYGNAVTADCQAIYLATEDSSKGLQIIANGETDCEITGSASLESSTYDTGATALSYNWIRWDGLQPAGTTIRFQLAASQNSSGPWTYAGPDGTPTSYYTNAGQEFINYNQTLNKRYLRYKVYLDTINELQPPLLDEVTISYTPY